MKLSFKEKSIWISLVATVIMFGYYFSRAIPATDDPAALAPLFHLLIWVLVLYIIIQIISQAIVAIIHKKEAEEGRDERDVVIALKSSRIAHYILVVGVWIIIGNILKMKSPLVVANMLFFFFIISEIVRYAVKLFYYRRGV